jgi:hypothetical protein
LILGILIGFVAAVSGGAVAGAVARRAEIHHAALLAVLMVVLETVEAPFATETGPVWYELAALLTGVCGVLLGGVFARWRAILRARREARRQEASFMADGLMTHRAGVTQESRPAEGK